MNAAAPDLIANDGLPNERMTAEIQAFLASYVSEADKAPRDKIDDYTIDMSRPLLEFSGRSAKAYAVSHPKEDASHLYAVLCDPSLPLRTKLIQHFLHNDVSYFPRLLAFKAVPISALGERRHVLLMERPKGVSLAEVLRQRGRLPEKFFIHRILSSIVDGLGVLEEHGVVHGSINLNTIYISDRVMLMECWSEPAGYNQVFYCDPIEHVGVHPLGRSEFSLSADCYALSVITAITISGDVKYCTMAPEVFNAELLGRGAFYLFVGKKDFSELVLDLFHATMPDDPFDRWKLGTIRAWLDGRRFNVMQPAPPKDAARPYKFAGRDYTGIKALAYGLHQNWDTAKTDLRDQRLQRWIETNGMKKELVFSIARARQITGGESTKNDRSNNELVTRTILALFPSGPLRYRSYACEVPGLGGVLADAFRNNDSLSMQVVGDIIEIDFPTAWAEHNRERELAPEISATLSKVQRGRMMMRQSNLGGGLERCLYDLNPTLPCQSPLLATYRPLSVLELLKALDGMATSKYRETLPVDRHIGAYICSRMEMLGDVRPTALSVRPILMNDADIIALELLRYAQEKNGNVPLPGLAHWLVLRLMNIVDRMYNKRLREKLRVSLLEAAQKGILSGISRLLVHEEMVKRDLEGYRRAIFLYHQHQYQIQQASHPAIIKQRSIHLGGKVALGIAYTAFACVTLIIYR